MIEKKILRQINYKIEEKEEDIFLNFDKKLKMSRGGGQSAKVDKKSVVDTLVYFCRTLS